MGWIWAVYIYESAVACDMVAYYLYKVKLGCGFESVIDVMATCIRKRAWHYLTQKSLERTRKQRLTKKKHSGGT